MNKVARELAETEVTKWLDTKKVFESVRETYKESVDLLIEAMQNGVLVYNESDNSFTHELLHPLNNEQPVTELKYKGRLNDNDVRPYLKGVAAGDGDARLVSTIAALTGKAKGIISALDTSDRKITNAIATFFF